MKRGLCAENVRMTTRTREDEIVRTSAPLGEPRLEGGCDVAAERCAAHLASLARAPHVRTNTEVHVAASKERISALCSHVWTATSSTVRSRLPNHVPGSGAATTAAVYPPR